MLHLPITSPPQAGSHQIHLALVATIIDFATIWQSNCTNGMFLTISDHREGDKAGYFRMEPVRNISSNPSEGFEFDFDWAANSKKVQAGTSLQFKPPCLTA